MPKSLQARARPVFLIRCTLSPLNSVGWKGKGVKFGRGGAGGSPVPFLAARFRLRAEAGSAKAQLVLSCDPCEGPPAPGCPSQRRQRWVVSVSPAPKCPDTPKVLKGIERRDREKSESAIPYLLLAFVHAGYIGSRALLCKDLQLFNFSKLLSAVVLR